MTPDETTLPSFTITKDTRASTKRYIRTQKHPQEQLHLLEKILSRHGLSPNEIKTYMYLAGTSEKKAAEISQTTSLHRTETYNVLRNLENKGLALTVLGKPVRFVAVPPYQAINHLLENERTKMKLLEKEKTDFLTIWSTIPKSFTEDFSSKEAIQVVETKPQVILKANELLLKTRQTCKIFAPDPYLTILAQGNFIETLKRRSYDLDVNLLVQNSLKSRIFLEETGWANYQFCKETANKLPCFMISDEQELLIINRKTNQTPPKLTALWTNSQTLTTPMTALFHQLTEPNTDQTAQTIRLPQTAQTSNQETDENQ